MARVLVTGAAGFIGFHLSKALLERGDEVIGFDNLNDYYEVQLKEARLSQLSPLPGFTFVQGNLADKPATQAAFSDHHPERVVNLAAQAGVRYSLTHPDVYGESNLIGFLNILECCRHNNVQHLVYASSSSVYGANEKMPFSVHDSVDHPVSLYAATKKANELMAHAYSHLYKIPTTGLRFFTVYGPWGRPDMSPFIFANAILNDKPLNVFNNGKMIRDFTYVDDIVEGVVRVLDLTPEPRPTLTADQIDPAVSRAPYRVYNIGNNSPVELMDFIQAMENAFGKKAQLNMLPMQPGDVLATMADVDDLVKDTGFAPATPIQEGVNRFAKWYREYYGY